MMVTALVTKVTDDWVFQPCRRLVVNRFLPYSLPTSSALAILAIHITRWHLCQEITTFRSSCKLSYQQLANPALKVVFLRLLHSVGCKNARIAPWITRALLNIFIDSIYILTILSDCLFRKQIQIKFFHTLYPAGMHALED